MNLTMKKALKLAIPGLALGLSSGLAFGDSCSNTTITNPVYDPETGILALPLVELLDESSEEPRFVAAEISWPDSASPPKVKVLKEMGEDCQFLTLPIPTFDFSTNELNLPLIRVDAGNASQTHFYKADAHLQSALSEQLELDQVKQTEGRYSGVILNGETYEPLEGATVSLNGVKAEQTTNWEGRFTVVGIGSEICQILTVNAAGFEPISMDVDIRFPDLTPCQG
jgi:hypothetical protein